MTTTTQPQQTTTTAGASPIIRPSWTRDVRQEQHPGITTLVFSSEPKRIVQAPDAEPTATARLAVDLDVHVDAHWIEWTTQEPQIELELETGRLSLDAALELAAALLALVETAEGVKQ